MAGNMGTVSKSVSIAVPADLAWDAVTDVGNLHVRVAPGMVTDTKLEDAGVTSGLIPTFGTPGYVQR